MRKAIYVISSGLLFLIFACQHVSENPEVSDGNKELVPVLKDSVKDPDQGLDNASADPCSFDVYFRSPKTSKLAKDIYSDSDWDLNNDTEALALLDSLTAKDAGARPFYFKVVTKSKKKSDGYYSEGLGLTGKEYIEKHTIEFLNYFENPECFTDEDLETWADIVLLEFSLGIDNDYNKTIVSDYCKVLNKNCMKCSSDQKQTLEKFSKILMNKWLSYIEQMKTENSQ